MDTPVVEFDQVSKDYPAGWTGRQVLPAVRDVSFQIERGEVFGLLGPNRAGKTTLLKILLGLCRPSAGQVKRFGRPGSDRSTLGRIGYVHESQAFPRYLTATSLLRYYGSLSLVPEEVLQVRVPHLLEQVGLADRAREPISRFSKGMSQRLGLAQALINDPDLLVLDEPTEGLDLVGHRLFLEVIAERRRQGRTVLLVSHLLSDVERVCDRVGILVAGRVVQLGSLPGLIHDSASGTSRSLEQVLQELYEKVAA